MKRQIISNYQKHGAAIKDRRFERQIESSSLRGAAASAEIHWISMGQHEHPPSDKDAPDFAVGAESDLGLLDVPDDLY